MFVDVFTNETKLHQVEESSTEFCRYPVISTLQTLQGLSIMSQVLQSARVWGIRCSPDIAARSHLLVVRHYTNQTNYANIGKSNVNDGRS